MTPSQLVSTEECEVLRALVDPAAREVERSAGLLAQRLAVGPKDAERLLRELHARTPPLVEAHYDDESAIEYWTATADGRRSHEEHCG